MQRPLFQPNGSPMRLGIAMSGSGKNARALIEHALRTVDSGYEVAAIFTDNKNEGNNATRIGAEYRIPVIVQDLHEYYSLSGTDAHDLEAREGYFEDMMHVAKRLGINFFALAGYMVVITDPFLKDFRDKIVNVHPSDIRPDGKPKYGGGHAVRDAVLAGEHTIASMTHLVTVQVDGGSPLLVSQPIPIDLPRGVTLDELKLPENRSVLDSIVNRRQELLKTYGDCEVFPKTMELMAKGRFTRDDAGVVCLDRKPIPTGHRLRA